MSNVLISKIKELEKENKDLISSNVRMMRHLEEDLSQQKILLGMMKSFKDKISKWHFQ